MVEFILKKRNGHELSKEELSTIIEGFTSESIPDYQISAFLMAIFSNGMTKDETANLTDIMMHSGDVIDLSEIKGIKVDKHSTGGVGDKTTLILAPLVAAAGVPVAKMSGRGLGHTGGTLDKMEAIKGLSVDMSREEFINQIKKHNIAVCGQNANLVPADKKLYALRDVTGTVDNISLISSSIMSKKLACGADAIVIDIKVGHGAFMKTVKEAEELADMMIGIGAKMSRKVIAVITSMNQPLGMTIGNSLEIQEAIETLKGNGPKDLTDLCMELGSHMLILGGVASNQKEAIKTLKKLIASGAAFNKFKELVTAQGGDVNMVKDTNLLPSTNYSEEYKSTKEGYINELNALDIGLASVKLGAGRATKESVIDYGAGIRLQKKIGDYVKKGAILATLYSNNKNHFSKAKKLMDLAYQIKKEKPQKNSLILKTVLSESLDQMNVNIMKPTKQSETIAIRNEGIPFDASLFEDLHVNRSAVERRAASLSGRRSVKKEWQAAWLLKALSCIDLTTLSGDDTQGNVLRLCAKAKSPVRLDVLEAMGMKGENIQVAAVCVYHNLIEDAVKGLKGSSIPIAAVSTGFPAGNIPLKEKIKQIELSVAAGAKEIDIVVSRNLILNSDWKGLYKEVAACRKACGDAHMKTILATGEIPTYTKVAKASWVSMMAGSDFIKTSTGKEPVNATIPVSLVMIRAIREYYELTGIKVGFKPAGGISKAKQAVNWLVLIKEELGNDWLNPDLFRFGASSLLGDIERQLEHFVTGRYSAAFRHPMA